MKRKQKEFKLEMKIEHSNMKPCPFCGSAKVTLQNLVDEDDFFVSCDKCNVQQIANYKPAEAIERWNRRAI